MDPLENPYRPGAGTFPPALVGRDGLIDDAGVTLRRALAGQPGKSLFVIGLRGVGKTVLLNRFVEIAEDEGFTSGFMEASENQEFTLLLAHRFRRILLGLSRGPVSKAATKALQVLKSFTLSLPGGASLKLEPEPLLGEADSGILEQDLADLLVAAGQAAQDRGQGVMIAVDEVQYLKPEELAALIVAVHRTTQLNLPVVVMGGGLPQLPGLAGEAKSYAERLFSFPEVGALSSGESEEAIRRPMSELGVEVTDEALRLVSEASGGYPYFLQEWGYRVWNTAEDSPVEKSDVELARPRVEESLERDFFRVRFDRLTSREKDYLRAMARLGPGPHRTGEVAHELGVGAASVGPRRAALIAKGMIFSPKFGLTAFTVPLFDRFLSREE